MAEVEKAHLPNQLANHLASSSNPAPVAHAGHLTALLDYGASFEGRLTFEGTVRIGGNFKGEIFTQDTLVINPGARVEAQIEADVVIISGTVVGNIFARRRIIMHPPAIFRGTVTSPSLRIDEGVMFEGASYMPKT